MRKLLTLVAILVLTVGYVGTASAIPAGALLWVKADAGVISDDDGVITWLDQSGNHNDAVRHPGTAAGAPQDSFCLFPKNGGTMLPAINFGGASFFDLPTAPFRLPEVTVYAVVRQGDLNNRSPYFSTYSNAAQYGFGFELDSEGPWLRSFTSAGLPVYYGDWIAAGCWDWPTLLTNEINAPGNLKSMYLKGALLGSTGVPGLTYDTNNETASIGALGQLGVFYMKGDIAEIIVYPSVDAQQKAEVESYLMNKYFIPEPATMTLLVLGSLALLRRRHA